MRTLISKVITVAMALTFIMASAEASGNHNVRKLAGTWELQGLPEPTCGVQPFTNYTSITRDGKIINADPVVGTGVGEAYRLGHKNYAAGFFGFIDDNGTLLTYEVQGTLTLLDSSHFTGIFRATVFDPFGNPACTYEGTIEGFRLVPMPY